ncbi:hypothetical protein ACLOJK_032491 [Asimina triloba]
MIGQRLSVAAYQDSFFLYVLAPPLPGPLGENRFTFRNKERMGILGTSGNRREELKEIHRTLTATIRLNGKSSEEKAFGDGGRCEEDGADQRLVCVTSGASYLGLAIVYQLLNRGYSLRLALENEDDVERFREMEAFQERGHQRVSALLVTLTELDSLCKAFDGCHGVFHTSCFADPSGVSGYSVTDSQRAFDDLAFVKISVLEEIQRLNPYMDCEGPRAAQFRLDRDEFDKNVSSPPRAALAKPMNVKPRIIVVGQKWMAEMEHRASRTVIEACARTASVRKCIFTSSLLACVWRSGTAVDLPRIVDERCWSDEGLCREKERSFSAAAAVVRFGQDYGREGRVDRGKQQRCSTGDPLSGPSHWAAVLPKEFDSFDCLSESLRDGVGATDMYKQGLLATVDISSLAQAHVCVYEETGESGRYVCFDRVVDGDDAAVELEERVRMAGQISGSVDGEPQERFELSNSKLSTLVLTPLRCSDDA